MAMQLKDFLPPQQIRTDPESRRLYSSDWNRAYGGQASVVVFPETNDQVIRLVEWARQQKVALVPSGGRTGLSGAAAAIQNECIVSLEKMNQILEFEPIEQSLRCQAGVI